MKDLYCFLVAIFAAVPFLSFADDVPYAIMGCDTPVLDYVEPKSKDCVITEVVRKDSVHGTLMLQDKRLIVDVSGKMDTLSLIEEYGESLLRFMTVDPLAYDYPEVSPYSYCLGDPINFVDPNGEHPIYSPDGIFLGTDDEGLQGEYYILNVKDFKQCMPYDDVLKYAIDGATLGDDVINLINAHFNDLPNRPDYDGYLTLKEANEWYRKGNGQTLFVDLSKIDLSGIRSLGERSVGQEKVFNLLFGASHNTNDGLVYGNVKFKRYPNNRVRAFADKYDFDMKTWNNPLNWFRNIETIIGAKYAGKGKPFTIYFCGYAELTPVSQYIK